MMETLRVKPQSVGRDGLSSGFPPGNPPKKKFNLTTDLLLEAARTLHDRVRREAPS